MKARASTPETEQRHRGRSVRPSARVDRGARALPADDRNALLFHLAKSDAIARGEFHEAAPLIAEVASLGLRCERVGIWLFSDDELWLRCYDEYDAREGEHRSGTKLESAALATYLHEATRIRTIAVRDVRSDARVAEFAAYFGEHRVVAMLDAPIRVAGRMIGTVCHHNLDEPRDWTPDDEVFAASIADLASIAYAACEKRQSERLQSVVYRIAQAADAATGLEDLYPAVHAIVGEVLPAENFFIALLDETRTRIRYPYFMDNKDTHRADVDFPLGGLSAWVIQQKKAVICDLKRRRELVESGQVVQRGTPALAWLGVPLCSGGEVIGVMAVQSYDDPDVFGSGDADIMDYVSTQVTRAIERKLHEEKLDARTLQQTTLLDLSQHALTSQELQGLLEQAATGMRQTLGVDFVHILEFEPSRDHLRVRAGAGTRDGSIGDATIPAGANTMVGYALALGAPVVVEDLAVESRFEPAAFYSSLGVTSGVTVIIQAGDAHFGAICALSYKRRRFGGDEVSFLHAVANMLGATIHRRDVEEDLQHERDFAMQVMQTLGQGVSVSGPDMRIKYVNSAYSRILGVPEHELIGRLVRDVVLPEDVPALEQACTDRLAGRTTTYEVRHRLPSGDVRNVLVTGVPRFVNGRVTGSIAVITDITELKRSEAALRESDTLFRAVSEQMPASLFLFDMDDPIVWGRIVHVNEVGLQMHGCTLEDALGHSIAEFLSESELEENQARAAALMAGDTLTFEALHRRKDGSEFPVTVGARMIVHGGRHLALCISHDITERNRHEAAMRRLVEGTANTGQAFFESLVRAMAEAFGTMSASVVEVLPCGKRARTLAYWWDGSLASNVEYELEGTPCEHVVKNHLCFYGHNVAAAFPQDALLRDMGIKAYMGISLHGSDGRVLGLMSLMHDKPMAARHDMEGLMRIFAARAAAELDRLQTLRILQASEVRARATLDAIPDLVLRHASDGTLLDAKAGDPRDLYHPAPEILGRNMNEFMPPDVAAPGQEAFTRALQTGELQLLNYELAMPHGRQCYEARIVPSDDELISFVRNVTEQRAVSEELRHSRERLQLALWGSDLGLWDWDLPGGIVHYGRHWLEILGYAPADLEGNSKAWERLLHPDDRERVLRQLNDHLEGRTPHFESEHRLRTKSGTWRWVLNRSKVWERSPTGEPLRFTGTHHDVSRQKRTMKRLVALHSERRELERTRRLQVVQAQENERTMLSRELHDGVGQILAGLQLSLLAKDTMRGDLAEDIVLARLATATVGQLSRLMSPPELELNRLFDTIVQYLCQAAGETKPEVTAELIGEEPTLEDSAKRHLFRITQEAVTNALKHGRPRRVEIRFAWHPEKLVLTVSDDGGGLSHTPRIGLGTRSIKDRAALLHGSATWSNNSRGGTTVRLVVVFGEAPRNSKVPTP